MKGWPWLTLGLLAVVLGVLWTAQGLDMIGGSVMSGVSMWAVIGPIVAVAGLILIVMGVRIRARGKQQS
jgi:type VI protein secretion system component VasK